MSMLAENKTRASWVLNPRASDWSKDQNKLGQKMLEKMGWSAGKGLGAKEQGPVEALRVAYKVDVRGLGASRKKEQEYWLQQQESFQSLLQNLNGGDDQNVEVKSLEERSKTSKTRLHYHKFTRGKDISRYSKKDLSCIVGSGVAAFKVIPASVISNSRQQSEDKLELRIGDDVLGNGESGAADHSTPDTEQHSKTEMRLRSEQKLSSGDSGPVVENAIPTKKKKSKKSSDCNVAVLEAIPSKSTVDEDSPQTRIRKSNRKLASDHETSTGDVVSGEQKRSKRKSARKTNDDVENISVEQRTPVEFSEDSSQTKPKRSKRKLADRTTNDEDETISVEHTTPVEVDDKVQNSSKNSRKRNKSKKDVSGEANDCSVVPVKRRKKNQKVETPLKDGVVEEESKKKPAKRGRKKKETPTNVETEDSAVEKRPKKKSKREIASGGGGDGRHAENEEIPTSLEGETETGKGKKKKKKKDNKSEKGVDPEEDLIVSESQETVVSSHALHENDDAETELGSINSQSSLINELLGEKMRSSIDHVVRPECWYKNHILSPDTDDEISSDEKKE